MFHLGFHEDYADWLSRSFHRLNGNSVELLKDLNEDSFFAVRLSTVYDFDYSGKEKNIFLLNTRLLSKGFFSEKRAILEDAISYTSDQSIMLSHQQITKVFKSARDIDKLTQTQRRELKTTALTQWDVHPTIAMQKEELVDTDNVTTAFFDIEKRHKEFKPWQKEIEDFAHNISAVFNEVSLKVNHVQCVTSSIAYQNSSRVKNQCWIVPAGQGKSVIHAEISSLFLKYTNLNVCVIFQNEGLKKVD